MLDLIDGVVAALIFVFPVAAFLLAQKRNQSPGELLVAATVGGVAAGMTVVVVAWPQFDSPGSAIAMLLPYVVGTTVIGFALGAILLGARFLGAWLASRR